MLRKMKFAVGVGGLALVVGGLSAQRAVAAEERTIILATTTSTQDSGLLDVLVPVFEKQSGLTVKTIAVGSGQAMTMGRKGEADVLLVHSPAAEEKFMAEGYGTTRRIVMHNDFVVVGPTADPAQIKGLAGSAEALKALGTNGGTFVSRGDNSGTHSKEKALWKAAGVEAEGQSWYQQTGLGMGQTLNVASEKGFYTLADRGTYLALKKNLALEILVEGERSLLNVYHVVEVSQAKWPKVNAAGAKAFADFMVADATQKTIAGFGVEKYGSPLFIPDAGNSENRRTGTVEGRQVE